MCEVVVLFQPNITASKIGSNEKLLIDKTVRLLKQLPSSTIDVLKNWTDGAIIELSNIPPIGVAARWTWVSLLWLFRNEISQVPEKRREVVIKEIEHCLATSQA